MPPLNTFKKTCIGLAISHLAAVSAHAATINVNVASDNLNTTEGSTCTLRKAVESVNNQALRPGCQNTGAFGTNDTIVVNPSVSNSSLTLQGAELTVGGNANSVINTTIQANGLTLDANNQSRAFNVDNADALSIDDITIINGQTQGSGGAITVGDSASLTLTNARLSHNETTNGTGGAIYVDDNASLTATNATLSYNQADRNNGAIRANSNTHLLLSNITISGNSAGSNGAIGVGSNSIMALQDCVISNNSPGAIASYGANTSIKQCIISNNNSTSSSGVIIRNDSGSLLIEQSSIYNNSVSGFAGSIIRSDSYRQNASLSILNSTLSNNTSPVAVEVLNGDNYNYNDVNATASFNNVTLSNNELGTNNLEVGLDSSLTIQNSIIASTNASSDCVISDNGVITTDANSIIQDGSCGGLARAVDPLLGPLADNGGPSLTHSLLSGSPAINTGDNATCEATDQRGESRPLSASNACDVGALEVLNDTSTFVIPLANGKSVIFDL